MRAVYAHTVTSVRTFYPDTLYLSINRTGRSLLYPPPLMPTFDGGRRFLHEGPALDFHLLLLPLSSWQFPISAESNQYKPGINR